MKRKQNNYKGKKSYFAPKIASSKKGMVFFYNSRTSKSRLDYYNLFATLTE